MKITLLAFLLIIQLSESTLIAQEFGIQLYSLRNQFKENIEHSLKTISDWGIKTIEGGDTYGMEENQFRALLDKYELNPISIGASYEDLRDHPMEVAQKALRYGARFVMCSWIPHDGNRFDIENTKAAVKIFNEAGAVLKREGITLAYHAHGYEFRPYEYGTLFDYMALNAKNFSLEMDVFWITHGGEDPVALMEKYPDFVVMLHLKDMEKGVKGNNTGGEDVETNVVLGQGQIDIEGVVRKAHEQGVRYMFIEDESSRVIDQVPKSLSFLNSISLK
ncbi:sugar phosphate isomerase/epimerase [Flavobacteriaceae bacterium]|nr:sugar phosphate isomerase/epimerase [Flavobacteriaceae bacterium]